MSGVYFLFQAEKLVYIGQSKNVEHRLATHNIDYDSYRVIPCSIPNLLHYEKRLIKYFKPRLNGSPGGKREGSGRKVGSFGNGVKKESVVMRIPVSLVPMIDEYVSLWKSGLSDSEIDTIMSVKYENYASLKK